MQFINWEDFFDRVCFNCPVSRSKCPEDFYDPACPRHKLVEQCDTIAEEANKNIEELVKFA